MLRWHQCRPGAGRLSTITEQQTEPIQDRTETTERASGGPDLGRPWVPGIILAVLITALVAVGATWFLTRPSFPADDSAEAGFARDMSTHHAQAVEMSLLVINRSESRDVVTLATDIATTQANQIGRMDSWLLEWDLPLAGDGTRMAWMSDGDPDAHLVNGRMPGMATPSQMQSLMDADGEAAEILYLQLMTTHHIAGVTMAEAVLPLTGDPTVSRLAETMVQGQQSEIDLMHDMLEARGAEPQEALGELQGDDGTGTLPPEPTEGEPGGHGH